MTTVGNDYLYDYSECYLAYNARTLRLNKYQRLFRRWNGRNYIYVFFFRSCTPVRKFVTIRTVGIYYNSVFNIRARLVGNIFRIRTRKTNRKLYIRAECIRDFRLCCRYTRSTVIVLSTSTSWLFFNWNAFFSTQIFSRSCVIDTSMYY